MRIPFCVDEHRPAYIDGIPNPTKVQGASTDVGMLTSGRNRVFVLGNPDSG